MDKPEFKIKIEGVNIAPEEVDVSDLLAMLADLRRAIVLMSDAEARLDNQPLISLTGIETGSDVLRFAASKAAIAAVAAISLAVSNGEYSKFPVDAQKSLHDLSRFVERKG